MADRFHITLSSPLGEELLFQSLNGWEELSQPFNYELMLVTRERKVRSNELLGQIIGVHVELPAGGTRHYGGHVTRFGLVKVVGSWLHYGVTVRPWLWLLSHSSNCRIFQNQSVVEIVKAVLQAHGFSDVDERLMDPHPPHEYVVQYRETDLQFVSRLLESEGIYYFFRHEESKQVLVLADAFSAHEPAPGCPPLPFMPAGGRRDHHMEYVSEWQSVARLQTAACALSDFDYKKPRVQLLVSSQEAADSGLEGFEFYDYPGAFLERADGEHQAKLRVQECQALREVVEAEANAAALFSGSLFDLTDHPDDEQNRQYLVVGNRFRLTEYERVSGSQASGADQQTYQSNLLLIPANHPFRPERKTPKPVIAGPQTAIVVGPSGSEIWTDELARVKVKFHWHREDPANETSSCWIRVAQSWSGAGFGAQFVPRMGHEVVVEFLEGDPDRPLITGSLYNGIDNPPFDEPTQSGVKSRSTKQGWPANANEIRFEDLKGSEEFYVQAEKDLEVLVKNNETRQTGVDRSTRIGANDALTVGVDRSGTIGANDSLKVGANSQTVIGGAQSVVVAQGRSITASAEVLNVGTRSKIVGTTESIRVGGARTEAVGGDAKLSIAGKAELSIGKDHKVTVSGDRNESVGKNDSLKVEKKLEIEAGDEIVIRTGQASMTLKKNGDIVIKGKNLKLDFDSKVNVKAGSDIALKGSKIGQN
ncbi:MAG TPA: type VI secretion system tip protein TssI/VgrG [Polyangiaceae bacterium]|nr:type VI secretion system tip protein TssI/VgrG [Polyangiaceae bacterium]